MDNKPKLNEQEEKELRDGQSLYEMTKTAGFQIVKQKLEDVAFHSWVDPREAPNEKEYLWRELNGFHAANNAREFLEWIQEQISRSDYLDKKKKGELQINPMRVGQ